MRLHTHHSENFIAALAEAIHKDPLSLKEWRCLHVALAEPLPPEQEEEILATIKAQHKDSDCEVICCAHRDVFFISRQLGVDALYALAGDFLSRLPQEAAQGHEMAMYDVFSDWRLLCNLLRQKNGGAPITLAQHPAHDFGEVDMLVELFDDARKLRRARMPLHIMLVEDDALTRRLVANSFKDRYALITAGTAQEAVANYLMFAPDIVFLDIGLPDASGFDVLQQIVARDSDAYVVMFSGNSYIDNITSALTNGASGFVAKPFHKDKLHHYIHDSAIHHAKHASFGG